jgi:outer membrane biosynthesis protein TonB
MTLIEKTCSRPFERNPLVVALVLSLLIHLVLYSTWYVGKQFHWWDQQSSWLLKLTEKILSGPVRTKALALPKRAEELVSREIPLTFVEVDPATAMPEAPPDAKYYSSANSKAANPDATVDTETPKVDGQQNKVVRLLDNDRPNPVPLQPSAPLPTEEPAPKPKGGQTPSDLAMAKTRDPAPPNDGQVDIGLGESPTSPKKRPRYVSEAKAQKQPMLAGAKMQQTGGINRHGALAFDARATAFGAYDAALIAAVQQAWYNMIEEHMGAPRTGKVVIEFRLTYEGKVINVRIAENDVGEILGQFCYNAITQPAPYGEWPPDMRRAIGNNYRDVKFTFYYF